VDVVVVATSPDIQAEAIAAAVAEHPEMTLAEGRVLTLDQSDLLIESSSLASPFAVVLVGPDDETEEPAERYLIDFTECVVARVTAPFGDMVRFAAHGIGLQKVLTELRELVDSAGVKARGPTRDTGHARSLNRPDHIPAQPPGNGLKAAIRWIHETLRNAVAGFAKDSGDLPGLTVTAATLLDLLDARGGSPPGVAMQTDEALERSIEAEEGNLEPLTVLVRTLGLSRTEVRVFLLALAPELDPRYQRCMGVLLDDLGRRVGTLGLFASLLGDSADVRLDLACSGNFARWRMFEAHTGTIPAADEPLRPDPALVGWILGEGDALMRDPRVRRGVRLSDWPGAVLIDREAERFRADTLVDMLQAAHDAQWLLLADRDAAGWRALIELGARLRKTQPIRVEAARLVGLEPAEIEECGIRFGRLACVTGAPLIVDVTAVTTSADTDESLRRLFRAVASTNCRVGVICAEPARVARLLGSTSYVVMETPSLPPSSVIEAFRTAARMSGAPLTDQQARALVPLHPLHVDGFHRAMVLARANQRGDSTAVQRFDLFMAACGEVAAEGLSRLAERIEPVFSFEQVILPEDRKQQLQEIVDNVLLADRVLDDWKFGEQLPYGRGVTALLHGPSGTGKTMAALAVAKRLGVPVLRIDLSRVVSKYIGDTEKNIDRVFDDARGCGAAVLIDEADALLGKRSEVKDAHDRYANIEVAFLLQRMEAFEGLAILTTNLWQNLDAAFLRRLRFIIDFPRPDVAAREKIWRQCLPEASRSLDAADFRLLARKIDLTGGHIRQITLRAAFVAAAANRTIGLEHVAYAVNAEFAKLGMPAIELKVGEGRKAA
jgi:AAA+ superfamily predicted ATPase